MAGKGKNAVNNSKSPGAKRSQEDSYSPDNSSSPSDEATLFLREMENKPELYEELIRCYLNNNKATATFEKFKDTEFLRKLRNEQPYTSEEYDEIWDKGLEGDMIHAPSSTSTGNDTDNNKNVPSYAKHSPSVSNLSASPSSAPSTRQRSSSVPPVRKRSPTPTRSRSNIQQHGLQQPIQTQVSSNSNNLAGTTGHHNNVTSLQQPSMHQGPTTTPMPPNRTPYGFSLRAKPRVSNYETDRVAIPRTARGISEKERNKSRELCTTAITPLIKRSNITKLLTSDSATPYDISEDASQWQMTLQTIHRHVVASDFKHIIMIPLDFDINTGMIHSVTDNEFINAILDHDKLFPKQYARWQEFLRLWGNQEEITSDRWLEEMLMKSLDPSLLREVVSEFDKVEEDEKGSITLLRIIINRIVQSNQESRRAMEEYIKNFDIRRFPGEDVTEACLRIKAIAQSIGTHQLPSDIIHRVLEGFAHASTPAFQNFCHTQESVISSSLVRNRMSPATLFQQLVEVLFDLETRYNDLRSGQRWHGYGHGTSAVDSAFVSSTSTNCFDHSSDTNEDYSVYVTTVGRNRALPYDVWVRDKTCHHCGEIGHVRPRCPHRDQPPIQRRDIRSKYHGNSRSNGTGGKNFITPTSGSRDNTSYKHSSSNRQSSNEKKEYVKKVLTAVMDMVDSDDTPSCDDAVENQVDDIDTSNTVLNAISSPTINESKYAAFLAALGCPKD